MSSGFPLFLTFRFHVNALIVQVLASYINPDEQWPPEESTLEEDTPVEESDEDQSSDLPAEFIDLVATSSLVPAICSYLRNDSGKSGGVVLSS